jgi:hypothetical protein
MPDTAPASDNDEGSGRRRKSRGSIAQRLISLSTLRSESRLSPRKTRFRLLARLCRAGLVTRRVPIKGFTLLAILLFRASWRKDTIFNYRRELGLLPPEPQRFISVVNNYLRFCFCPRDPELSFGCP